MSNIQALISTMKTENANKYFSSISQFKFLQRNRIGKGSFGQVKLAIHKETSKIYAIKIIECNTIQTEVGLKSLYRQIQINATISHPHVVKVWQVLKENQRIYMIMEYVEKGNLFSYQNSKKIFTEEQASIFFMQTLSAIQYLHSLNLIHRDIKPENLLLDEKLNIKVCDLGWTIQGVNQMHTTFCGTYQYMAPQMIFQHSYDHKVDIWALGILLYQLLHGNAPFQGSKAGQVKTSMVKGQIHIDSDLSSQVQDLIINILKVNPKERLSIKQIKQHAWLSLMRRRNQQKTIDQVILLSQKPKINKSVDSFKVIKQKINDFKSPFMAKDRKKIGNSINNISSSQKIKRQSSKKSKKLLDKTTKQKQKQRNKNLISHKSQKSNLSQVFKHSRLKTELCESKMKLDQTKVRINTQTAQTNEPIDQRSTIKKKNIMGKKIRDFMSSIQFQSTCPYNGTAMLNKMDHASQSTKNMKSIRKSID